MYPSLTNKDIQSKFSVSENKWRMHKNSNEGKEWPTIGNNEW